MYRIIFVFLFCISCTSTVQNKQVIGEVFPSVQGTTLDGKKLTIPNDITGTKTLLLIGYEQDTQFDIDRWLIGLDQKGYILNVFEVPTIQGWIPSLIQSKINNGMRSGIPKDLWKVVLTVYKDADQIVSFLGNTNPKNARAIVLSEQGKVLYQYDQGFSVSALNGLGKFFKSKINCN